MERILLKALNVLNNLAAVDALRIVSLDCLVAVQCLCILAKAFVNLTSLQVIDGR